ncbi:nitroreductase family protein [Acinetobacter sp. C_4_1]|uniref:nitroreductase family protein n=1 Tax=unclassified Acinetobacter TaxID=196816 RepID=UPI0021B78C13|nr:MULTISPECIES: nitroreductase family protein [unclassified Acinetobacter]MCT8089263.1 nitroreductase family protein [Acinetobacter sp. F_3_1]MCT8097418.1 nitroreductase family protein [Acinetobacter sp. C_3_1]MCT8100294.1 nitroreductase family protein [Acinetobacter sp. C_4_1]MCT8133484.1 nitroreductase family protein [Acinetobacter sp. T_3_1]
MSFLAHMKQRRTIYAIGQNVPITADQIEEVIKDAVRNSPSAFNSQTSRVVTLYGDSHAKFWNIVRETLRKLVPEEAFENTNTKINGFAAGYGTVLFFEDQDVVKSLQEQFPLYAEHFPAWSEHSTGIAQFAVWSSLAEQHIGASLQHYNPVIDDEVAATFDIPKNWKLRAELVFGSIEAPAGEKTFLDDSIRFKRFD